MLASRLTDCSPILSSICSGKVLLMSALRVYFTFPVPLEAFTTAKRKLSMFIGLHFFFSPSMDLKSGSRAGVSTFLSFRFGL